MRVVSRRWKPPSRPWTRADAYVVTGGKGRRPAVRHAIAAFMAAAMLGIGAGALLGGSDAPEGAAAADLPAVQSVHVGAPARVADAKDREWAARADGGLPRAPHAHTSAGVVHFSYCKWGGGMNCVVDGDTFWIAGQKVRIADIDAPETHDYRCGSELELGERAARQLQAFLNSGAVTLTSIDRDRDKYGRLLRNVSVNGRDVGGELVSEGLARPWEGHRRPWC